MPCIVRLYDVMCVHVYSCFLLRACICLDVLVCMRTARGQARAWASARASVRARDVQCNCCCVRASVGGERAFVCAHRRALRTCMSANAYTCACEFRSHVPIQVPPNTCNLCLRARIHTVGFVFDLAIVCACLRLHVIVVR